MGYRVVISFSLFPVLSVEYTLHTNYANCPTLKVTMVLLFKEELMANLALSVVATMALVWVGQFPGWTFKSLFSCVFAVDLGVQLFWDVIIYPYFVSPLRNLPRVPVLFLLLVAKRKDKKAN